MEFHISRASRDFYRFDHSLFTLSGNVVFANVHAVRLFAQKMNAKRDLLHFPERAVRAGDLNAMGLLDEILHYVAWLYRQQVNPQALQGALTYLEETLGKPALDAALRAFTNEFPPLAVYRREVSVDDYLAGQTDGMDNRLVTLEEMLMLWLSNRNPALTNYLELFDDSSLRKTTAYDHLIDNLHIYFETQPPFGPLRQNLVDMLRSPAIAAPYSVFEQLEYIRQHWAGLIGKFMYRLLTGLDLMREEQRFAFLGPGPSIPPTYDLARLEPERFSPDKDWMPRLVLIAKNTYVWLDQLSKKYRRAITRLDQIPDEELDALARWGFSGLWLIGVWERSRASQTIKQLCGNPEAVASAYSIYAYQIAADLGGEEAFQALRGRAWERGIRLASDMVPNHMGIDSPWVLERPDWFIALDYSPFPSYTFNGPNLSGSDRVGIYLEDHYYTRSDAAVVFKRVDWHTGNEKYIYHGNDGTSMPWNDTAQLNYLNPEVREAVIQTILSVARRFPIIRFDAAMTLTKKHFQRLWFPEPGSGGAIPSRADHGMTREQFDALMPVEFWREVVDRVAQEAPDTLLLAEAFWLMEGYFVRTLGMHRVYNSAFMNMLRNEDNANYRLVMKNTLEFDPEILKRFVNFMNNPDERTAVDQFGKGDKYFGICTMMVTLPGLPMFGHGQIEGYAEKYGMEFRRAYWDESPDPALVERHEREIFPLLHRRHLFAGVENFLLYDFFTPEGTVNEDVFAYSNGDGRERALVIYHNRYASARGWVRTSVGFAARAGSDGKKRIVQKTLAEGLGLHPETGRYVLFRDHLNGLEYIRSSKELAESGLYVELDAYKAHVFLDFREVEDNEWGQYAQLKAYLNGRGVPSIQEALQELFLRPVHAPYRDLVSAETFRRLQKIQAEDSQASVRHFFDEIEEQARRLLREIKILAHGTGDENAIAAEIRRKLKAALELPEFDQRFPLPGSRRYQAAANAIRTFMKHDALRESTLWAWAITHLLGKVVESEGYEIISRSWIDEWLLGRILHNAFLGLDADDNAASRAVQVVSLLTTQSNWPARMAGESAAVWLQTWLAEEEVQRFLGFNRYQDILWYNREAFDEFLLWMETLLAIWATADDLAPASQVVERILAGHRQFESIRAASRRSNYQVEILLEKIQS
jgi:glycosidase